MSKVKFGITIDENMLKKLDAIVRESEYLDVSRSEVVEALLAAYFKSDFDHIEKARELVIRRRNKLL